ncbi:MAG: VOC family protein [Acidimicrobiales bacterium]
MLRLRQVALVASDLATSETELGDALGLDICFRDPGVGAFGLHNALFLIGDRFLEIVSPTQENTTAGRLLERRQGDGGYMVILQTDDLAPFRERFDTMGVRVVYEAVTDGIVGLHLHPRDLGSAIVSIDRTDEPAEWPWGGPSWRDHQRTDVVTDLVGVELQADDPVATAQRWGEALARPVAVGDDGVATITLDDATIRFTSPGDDRGPGVTAIDVVATDRSRAGTAVEHVGIRINFV